MQIINGDCLDVMKSLPDNSVDAVVTDPPYELGFMGKSWDRSGIAFNVAVWAEALRVLKPGGHLLAFGGSRTYHRIACAIEDAGFEIRDQLQWLYGSGFPKSLSVGKAIDKMAGAERTTIRPSKWKNLAGSRPKEETTMLYGHGTDKLWDTAPATPDAQKWEGWGTALKPAHEPIVLARKPFPGTVAENVLEYGTGAINIDGCRIETDENLVAGGDLVRSVAGERSGAALGMFQPGTGNTFAQHPAGRWPANIIHDGSDEVVGLFPQTKPGRESGYDWGESNNHNPSRITKNIKSGVHFGDSGSAARFFYCAKASRFEREAGLENLPLVRSSSMSGRRDSDNADEWKTDNDVTGRRNFHPTVKPIALMQYLCRLITPPGGVVLDPFAGSGTTGCAAVLEGLDCILIDLDADYVQIAKARVAYWKARGAPKERGVSPKPKPRGSGLAQKELF